MEDIVKYLNGRGFAGLFGHVDCRSRVLKLLATVRMVQCVCSGELGCEQTGLEHPLELCFRVLCFVLFALFCSNIGVSGRELVVCSAGAHRQAPQCTSHYGIMFRNASRQKNTQQGHGAIGHGNHFSAIGRFATVVSIFSHVPIFSSLFFGTFCVLLGFEVRGFATPAKSSVKLRLVNLDHLFETGIPW